MLVADALVTVEFTMLNVERSLAATVSKLVPLIVTAVPGVPIVGVNPVIVGAAGLPVVTVKDVVVVAEPNGDVTVTTPVVAPDGTVVTIKLVLEAARVAATPLNATEFWLAVALKPAP